MHGNIQNMSEILMTLEVNILYDHHLKLVGCCLLLFIYLNDPTQFQYCCFERVIFVFLLLFLCVCLFPHPPPRCAFCSVFGFVMQTLSRWFYMVDLKFNGTFLCS